MADVRLDIPASDPSADDLHAFINERLGLDGSGLQIDPTVRTRGNETIFLLTVAPVIVGFFTRFGEDAAGRLREVRRAADPGPLGPGWW